MPTDKRSTILIADNDEASVSELSGILRAQYDVITAPDGKSAIEKATAGKPDLILLEVYLPDMKGFDVITTLRGSDETMSIPIVIITSSDDVQDEEMCFFLGAFDYIRKPFQASIVMARVKRQLTMLAYIRTIEELGMIDPLTNIPNRRSFDHQLEKEWVRAMRERYPLSMLMIDVDRFKNYNDKYGHTQGDVLLQAIAGIFSCSLKRPADFVARWGGEEFAVLLPNTDDKGAHEVAEHMRANVEEAIIYTSNGESTQVTVSIGVITVEMPNCLSMYYLVEGADAAMYKAKELGRNRVESGG